MSLKYIVFKIGHWFFFSNYWPFRCLSISAEPPKFSVVHTRMRRVFYTIKAKYYPQSIWNLEDILNKDKTKDRLNRRKRIKLHEFISFEHIVDLIIELKIYELSDFEKLLSLIIVRYNFINKAMYQYYHHALKTSFWCFSYNIKHNLQINDVLAKTPH